MLTSRAAAAGFPGTLPEHEGTVAAALAGGGAPNEDARPACLCRDFPRWSATITAGARYRGRRDGGRAVCRVLRIGNPLGDHRCARRFFTSTRGEDFAVVFDTGDEMVSGLLDFARKNQPGGDPFTAPGASR